jgi:succinate-acetate transporter protein
MHAKPSLAKMAYNYDVGLNALEITIWSEAYGMMSFGGDWIKYSLCIMCGNLWVFLCKRWWFSSKIFVCFGKFWFLYHIWLCVTVVDVEEGAAIATREAIPAKGSAHAAKIIK